MKASIQKSTASNQQSKNSRRLVIWALSSRLGFKRYQSNSQKNIKQHTQKYHSSVICPFSLRVTEQLVIAQAPRGLRQEVTGALPQPGAAAAEHRLDRRVDARPHAGPGDVGAKVTGEHGPGDGPWGFKG